MTQTLRACATFSEDPSSVSNTQYQVAYNASNFNFRGSDALLWSHEVKRHALYQHAYPLIYF